jgi:MFS family permease
MFYGWIMVALTFYTQFVVLGTVFYSHGILFKPIAEDIGGTRFAFGMALPAFFIIGGLMGPVVGYALLRYSVRQLMILGAAILSVGFYLLSISESLLMFYLSFGVIIAIGMALLGGLTNTVLVANWFDRKRGTALGISQFGVSASGMVMAYVTPWLITLYGWRGTTEIFAIIPLLIVAPVVWWLVVSRPEDMGLKPDGVKPDDDTSQDILLEADDWPIRRVLGSANFWLIVGVIGFNFAANGAVILKIYPFATDSNYSLQEASLVLSLMAGMAALGKPLFGWLGDQINNKVAMLMIIGTEALGLALIILADSHTTLVAAAILFGLGYGGLLPMWGVLLGTCFGRLAFGRIMGLMGPMLIPFQTLGVPLADWIYDRSGSYSSAFAMFMGLYLMAILLVFFIRLPDRSLQAGLGKTALAQTG